MRKETADHPLWLRPDRSGSQGGEERGRQPGPPDHGHRGKQGGAAMMDEIDSAQERQELELRRLLTARACLDCGEPVPEERGQAMPGCQFCVRWQEVLERRQQGECKNEKSHLADVSLNG